MKVLKNSNDIKSFLAKRHKLSFSEKVWRACYRIPKGKVATYSLIAKMIGQPGASRAVGNALNKNPFAPIVPCHRIVRSDGVIGGFASGSLKKAQLLKAEGIEVRDGRVSLDEVVYRGA